MAEQVLDRLDVKMLGESVAPVSFINKQQAKEGAIVNVRKIAVIGTYPPANFVKLD